MHRYFDEDFFKLLLGFIAIISISLIIVVATRIYMNQPKAAEKTTIDAKI